MVRGIDWDWYEVNPRIMGIYLQLASNEFKTCSNPRSMKLEYASAIKEVSNMKRSADTCSDIPVTCMLTTLQQLQIPTWPNLAFLANTVLLRV